MTLDTEITKNDMLSWLVHTIKMAIVFLVFCFIINVTAGFVIAALIIFLREKDQNHNEYEFWLWNKLDSILDWFIPVLVLIGMYWFFNSVWIGYWS